MGIVEIMNMVLSSSNLTVSTNESGLHLITATEAYGEYLLGAVDSQVQLYVKKENISKMMDQWANIAKCLGL